MPNISQIPLNKVPFLDPKNPGLVSREWYRFLNNLFTLTGAGSTPVTLGDLQVGPEPAYPDQLSVLQAELQALGVAPAHAPHGSESRYGSFYSAATQTAAVTNTAYPVTFTTIAAARGVVIGSPASRLTVDRPGVYQISAELQYVKTGGPAGTAVTWLRKNGADIADSGIATFVTTTNPQPSQPFTYLVEMAAGDYFEIVWGADSTAIQLQSTAASAPYPEVPSARVNVIKLTG